MIAREHNKSSYKKLWIPEYRFTAVIITMLGKAPSQK